MPHWKILRGDEAVVRAAGILAENPDRLSSVVTVEEAIGLIPALRKALEEGRPAALHLAYDRISDLSPFLALGLPVLVSGSAQEAADLGTIAALAARAAETPVLHAYDRLWVGEELAKIDVLSEDELKDLDRTTPRGGKETFSDRLASLFRRFEALAGRAPRFCEFSGPADAVRVGVAAGSEAENLRDDRTALVSLKLLRPLPARALLEALPSTAREIATPELLRGDVLAALHEGIVGGWSWFVALPPLLPLPAVPSHDGPADVWKAVLRASDRESLTELEAAVRGLIEDLAPRSPSYFQCHTMTEAAGGSLHLRIAPHPIRERRPIASPALVLSWEGSVLTTTPAGRAPRSIDLEALGRETGLGKRVGPVVASFLLSLMDSETVLGLARGRAEEILRDAVEERWGDFSQDIVVAHRKAMDFAKQALCPILSEDEIVVPLRPSVSPATRDPGNARADLKTRYLGFALRTPLVVCVPPDASDTERRAVAVSPAGAVFFGPVAEEDLDREAWKTFENLNHGARGPGRRARPPLERYAERLKEWKDAVEVPLIAGLSAATEKNWLALAFTLEQAGADALEVILRSPREGGPSDPLRVVSLVSAAVRVPVALRITPDLAGLCERLEDVANAGAKALVLYQPPSAFLKDPLTLEETRENLLGGPEVLRLALPDLSRMASHSSRPLDLAAAGPVSATGDLLRALLSGSRAVYVASGPDTPARLETSLSEWMASKGFSSLEAIGENDKTDDEPRKRRSRT